MDTLETFEKWLNNKPIPLHMRQSNGGKIPDEEKLGTWLRTFDLSFFLLGYENFYLTELQNLKKFNHGKEN